MLTTILTILGTLAPTILQNAGVIGPSTTTLITNLLGPIETLIGNLKSGQSATQDGLAALAAMAGVIAVLKANTSLPPAVLTEIANVDADVQAALAGYAVAQSGYNAGLYTQIAPVA